MHHEVIAHGSFTKVRLYRPPVPAPRLLLLLSGDGGWGTGVDEIARRLTGQGVLVAGIDVRAWLARLQDSRAGCASPGEELAELARFLVAQYQAGARPPLLLGHSAGATLAYVALLQAPAQTFAGAMTLSFCADLDLRRPLCPSPLLHAGERPAGLRLQPATALPAPWVALHGLKDRTCPVSDSREFTAGVQDARFVPLPGVGHSYSDFADWWPQLAQAYAELSVAAPAETRGGSR